MPTVVHPDPFNAVMLASVPLVVTEEQKLYVRKVLDKACSDSRFAEKAYVAISHILSGQMSPPPVVTSLTPNSAEIGDPSFTLHVHGTGFKSGSVIVFNGGEEPTTYVSATELTTGVDMSTAAVPVTVPVSVLSSDGVMSDPMNFTFTDGTAARKVEEKPKYEDKKVTEVKSGSVTEKKVEPVKEEKKSDK
jgi:IPT/TIG domain